MAMPVPEEQQCGTPLPPAAVNLLEGLGVALENAKFIRKYALNHQALLQWLAPNKVGVVSNKSLKLNAAVLEIILRHWCPNAADSKTVPIGWLKLEAGEFGNSIFGQNLILLSLRTSKNPLPVRITLHCPCRSRLSRSPSTYRTMSL